jgi:hypothetical protein
MIPTCALAAAFTLLTPPGPPAEIELTFAPVPVTRAPPSDSNPRFGYGGHLHAVDAGGRPTYVAGDLLIWFEVLGDAGQNLRPEISWYSAHHLPERLTATADGHPCYDLFLPCPESWPKGATVRVKASLKVKGGNVHSPEVELSPPKGN